MSCIYLAGPIDGLHVADARSWRQSAADSVRELFVEPFFKSKIDIYDPTETADEVIPEELRQECYPSLSELPQEMQYRILSANAQGLYVMTGMIAYIPGGKVNPNSGTAAEMEFALRYKRPLVVVTLNLTRRNENMFDQAALDLHELILAQDTESMNRDDAGN